MRRAAKRKRARAARRVEHGHFLDGVPEGAEQFRRFGIDDGVAGELPDVEIQRDQFVDLVDLALA